MGICASGCFKTSIHANQFLDSLLMRAIIIYLSVLIDVFILPAIPAFAEESGTGAIIKEGLSKTASESGFSSALSLPEVIGKLISVVLGAVGIVFIVIAVYAGIMYMTAAGDTDKVKKAKSMLIQAVIGIIIIVGAYALSNFVVTRLINAAQ